MTGEYGRLLAVSALYARMVAAQPEPTPPHARFMHREAVKLAAVPANGGGSVDNPGARFAALCAARWHDVADGADEAAVLAGTGLWRPLMYEWPMGAYAVRAARALQRWRLANLDVFEVGSGVGNLARLVAADARSWVRSDVRPALCARQELAGTVEAYDVNEPGRPERADVVVAVNAAHCARSPLRAVANMAAMVRPGGHLVLAEGAPYPGGWPWALTWCFGLLDGWWTAGGFVPRSTWTDAMRAAGLDVHVEPMREGRWDLGGLVVGRRA